MRKLIGFGLATIFLSLGCAAGSGGGGAEAPGAGPKSSGGDGPPIAQSCSGGLLDDGEDGDNQVVVTGGRGGYWYTYSDTEGTTIEPSASGFKMTEGGADSSKFAARFHGKVGNAATVYAGLGFSFTDPKGEHDVSKFKAIAFWGKAAAPTTVRIKLPDGNTSPEGKKCTECYNDFGQDVPLTTEWTRYVVPFDAMKQQDGWGAPQPASIDASKVYGVQFQVSSPGVEYDVWLDNIELTGCE